MQNKIPIELDSNYEIRGKITAFELTKQVYTYVRLLADIEYSEDVKGRDTHVNVFVYDQDGDILGQDHICLRDLNPHSGVYSTDRSPGLDIRIPDHSKPSKVILRTRKNQ